jgi:hypothetical protein
MPDLTALQDKVEGFHGQREVPREEKRNLRGFVWEEGDLQTTTAAGKIGLQLLALVRLPRSQTHFRTHPHTHTFDRSIHLCEWTGQRFPTIPPLSLTKPDCSPWYLLDLWVGPRGWYVEKRTYTI